MKMFFFFSDDFLRKKIYHWKSSEVTKTQKSELEHPKWVRTRAPKFHLKKTQNRQKWPPRGEWEEAEKCFFSPKHLQ